MTVNICSVMNEQKYMVVTSITEAKKAGDSFVIVELKNFDKTEDGSKITYRTSFTCPVNSEIHRNIYEDMVLDCVLELSKNENLQKNPALKIYDLIEARDLAGVSIKRNSKAIVTEDEENRISNALANLEQLKQEAILKANAAKEKQAFLNELAVTEDAI